MKKITLFLLLLNGGLGFSQCTINVNITVQNASDSSQCDGSIIATTSGNNGPVTYSWNCNGCVSFNSPSISGLCFGANGTLTVIDTAGCTGTAFWNIGVSPCSGFGANLTTTPASGPNTCDGSILASPFGGTAPYYYAIGNGTVSYGSNNPTNLCAGNYTVNVDDANGCSFSTTTNVAIECALSLNINIGAFPSSPSLCNGVLYTIIDGIVGVPSFAWNNGDSSAVLENLCPGTYQFCVTDGIGCQVCDSITIYDSTTVNCVGFTANLNITNVSAIGLCDGSIVPSVIGGTAPYIYLWSNGSTTATQSNLCTAVYDLTVTDPNGCAASASGYVGNGGANVGDTIVLNGNISIDSSFIGADSSDWINDCSIYYDSVISGYINSFSAISNDSVNVSWVLGYANGDSVVVTAVYNLNSGNGTYLLTLLLYCPQKSVPKYLIVNSEFNFQLSSLMETNYEKLMVYPNPVVDFIFLKGVTSTSSYKILDLSGKKVLTGNYNQRIDASQLGQGTYLLIVSANNKEEVLRFIK